MIGYEYHTNIKPLALDSDQTHTWQHVFNHSHINCIYKLLVLTNLEIFDIINDVPKMLRSSDVKYYFSKKAKHNKHCKRCWYIWSSNTKNFCYVNTISFPLNLNKLQKCLPLLFTKRLIIASIISLKAFLIIQNLELSHAITKNNFFTTNHVIWFKPSCFLNLILSRTTVLIIINGATNVMFLKFDDIKLLVTEVMQ